MNQDRIDLRIGVLIAIIALAAAARFLPLPPNVSPLAAMALFGAAYFNRRWMALVFPLAALWLSNFLLDNLVYAEFYEGTVWFSNEGVYIAFLLIIGLGWLVFRKVNVQNVLLGSLGGSVLFFLVTNFAVWLSSGMYPPTWAGLVECFTLALPFFRNTVLGDLAFAGVLFGAFELAKQRFPGLAWQRS